MRQHLRRCSWGVLVLLGGTPLLTEEIDTSWVRVKQAVADRMTPEELQAHKERLAKNFAHKRPGFDGSQDSIDVSADICSEATHEAGLLPFASSGTTVGEGDNYDLPPDVSAPTCTASTNCTGAGPVTSLPRGAVYTGTGTGPDHAYRIRVSDNCDLTIDMAPTSTQDLALIVYESNCSSSLSDCVCVSDTGFGGQSEQVLLNAVTGVDYFVVIDGYSSGATPPGPSGPFNLSITGTGCSLTGPPAAATCPLALAATGSLPRGPLTGDTTGQGDNYDLPVDSISPTCTAASRCVGAGPPESLPRGAVYTGTGTGPDAAFRFAVDRNCVLGISGTPTSSWDLALIAYEAGCSSSLADCVCVDDTDRAGEAESLALDAMVGRTYFVVVDGYSSGGTPPGPSGPFDVSIAETSAVGCQLVPPCTGDCPIFGDGFEIGTTRFWTLQVP